MLVGFYESINLYGRTKRFSTIVTVNLTLWFIRRSALLNCLYRSDSEVLIRIRNKSVKFQANVDILEMMKMAIPYMTLYCTYLKIQACDLRQYSVKNSSNGSG